MLPEKGNAPSRLRRRQRPPLRGREPHRPPANHAATSFELLIERTGSREWYDRVKVQVAWRASRNPLREEAALIRRYKPADNTKGLFDEEPARPKRSEYDDADALNVSLLIGDGIVPF
jgi:hypothetical protein